jgi:hypothetical protein
VVNVTITELLILLLPFVAWIVGMKARIPIVVLLSGIMFVGVALFFASVFPLWLVLSLVVLGLVLSFGSVVSSW